MDGEAVAEPVGPKRRNTTLEAEGAELLVLGQLLIRGVPAYKAYARNAGHDLVALNPAAAWRCGWRSSRAGRPTRRGG